MIQERVYGTLRINGIHCPVTNMFDIDGDETDDLELVETVVCKVADDKWITAVVTITGVWPLQ